MKKLINRLNMRNVVAALLVLVFFGAIMFYQTHKPLPEGISYEGQVFRTDDVNFLYDLSYKDKSGNFHHESRIFERVNEMIAEAEDFVVIDMFLFNSYYDGDHDMPDLAGNLTKTLIEKKRSNLEIEMVFITDHINTTYGSHHAPEVQQLKENGIKVMYTDLKPLRDSNYVYSAVWRTFFQWFQSEPEDDGWLPNPLASTAPDVTLRSYLELLNVKANHRKVVVTDQSSLVTSANPHNASGLHSNIAFEVGGPIIGDILETEKAAARYSDGPQLPDYQGTQSSGGSIKVQVLTEGKIYKRALAELDQAGKGDTVWLGMFYLAEREVIDGLVNAARRGADVRIILDPNQNAFGNQKMGLPNIPVASELEERGEDNIHIRWYNTKMEQYHTKLLYIKKEDKATILGGSTNYTTRNFEDLNLETNLWVETPLDQEINQELSNYFNRIWDNEDALYTEKFSEKEYEMSWVKYIGYRIQKLLNFTTY
ncbi:phospholipase [Rossellomorea vietnamensis]|uniref:phospholipase D n=1 Tax=Rossellomorea vietnamensis TaxID=218284 RepID=A0A5D4M562_9BACI|nr:phospholipase D family protein [Rossellomorea vietnamensis]TYR96776.1 phospholipase [Rossellomorea vietnamensis]